ncbi:MAG TPA: SCO family protein [Candidatus Krumholzibacteria bacterium]|nr:SCO family protein [Candidatus Krumholzibacteria bacterium]
MKRIVVVCAILGLAATAAAAGPAESERPELSIGRSAQYDYDPPVPGSYALPVIDEAGDGEVLTAEGKRARLRDIVRGQVTILSFIYTRCADPRACPMATGALFQIHGISLEDPEIARGLRLVTFSFDPEHDTPSVMAEYGGMARPGGQGSEWWFLTTRSTAELEPILAGYHQRVDRKKNPLDPLGPFYHVVRVYLIDRNGMVRNIYSYGLLDPRMVLTDVRTLLMESSLAGK